MVKSESGLVLETPAAAVAALVARVAPVATERIALRDAAGRVLSDAIRTDRPSPGCDVSAMDGFAVCASDVARLGALSEVILSISGEVRIGQAPPSLREGTALRIVTGAPLPPGADAIVRREHVLEREGSISIDPARASRLAAGEDVRRRGENAAEGDLVIGGGIVADGARVSALASFGASSVEVRRRVRVKILVTGDELVEVDQPASPWQVRDGNGPALAALLARPWIDVERLPRAPDERAALSAAVERALEGADALVLTGGVSMGVHDYVPGTLRALGVEVLFHKLPQRPGKPILAGIASGGRPVLALPGNPVSVLVTATRIALPALARRAGLGRVLPRAMVRLEPASEDTLGLWWYRPVVLEDDGRARLVGGRGSGDVVAAARSDGFVEIPPHVAGQGPFPFFAWGECR